MYSANIDLGEFLELYNPLAFKDARGNIMYFKTYVEAYEELFDRLYKAGPYMIDAVVFCMDNYGMKIQDAQRFVNSWQRYIDVQKQYFLIDWKTGGKERDLQLEKFARGLHLLLESKFNKDMFLCALDKMKEKLKIEK